MKRLVNALAFLSSLASLLVIAGMGVVLLAIENSGERSMGALIAVGSAIAFGAVMALLFAREGAFANGLWRAVAIAAAIVGALPVAALAFAAIRFAGLPLGSRIPLIDWGVLAAGLVLALGTIAILALGHRRSQDVDASFEPPVVVHMQQIRHAQQQLRSVFDPDQRKAGEDMRDEVRVRRV